MNNELLLWIWTTAEEALSPFDGCGEMEGNIIVCKIWHCHGCDGELRTYWRPYQEWIEPNDDNFKHEVGCRFVELKKLIEETIQKAEANNK